jgi:signal transduction histidine kinase/CheY-like chemotaxis protein/HAMP domain-containing protein
MVKEMRLRDFSIGIQLRLGLGLILALVATLAILAWDVTDQIWRQTETLYEHPLKVRRAIGRLETDVLAMRLEYRNMLLAGDERDIQEAIAKTNVLEADAERQFEIVFERYLGPRSDVETAHEAFIQWVSLRAGNRDLARAGKIQEAMARLNDSGDIGRHRDHLLRYIQIIDDYARNKGDELFRTATGKKTGLEHQLLAILTLILVLSLAAGYGLWNLIRVPLDQLNEAAQRLRQGETGVRCDYDSRNEFGVAASAFNTMAEAIETEARIGDQAARLAEVMLRETELESFCREVLKTLVEYTGSQVGAVYLLNPAKTAFEHYTSIGLDGNARGSFFARSPEGEFGSALVLGQIRRITNIPEDTPFTFAAVSGTFRPREIITIPLLAENEAVAVISLAGLREYDPVAIRLLTGIQGTLTARMNGVLGYRKIQELAQRLEHQNRELEEQKKELGIQTNELTLMNTELEAQKNQVNEANRLKSAFLSNMSHELRTPLNSVIALSGVLGRRLSGKIPEDEFGFLEVIERNGRHLLSLINNILDLSRIEAGREDVQAISFSLDELVAEVVAMVEPQAGEKGIELRSRTDNHLEPLVSDPDKLRHILQNLVGNAVKFTDSGWVEVRARRVNGEIEVAVQDTGIGIEADQFAYIFDEFRQVDDRASKKYGGAGLGLAIARKYARLLGGGITVESTPGRGSTFTFRQPFVSSPAEVPSAASSGTEKGSAAAIDGNYPDPGRNHCLLLVEDSEPAVIQMTDILAGQGYQVQVARGGHEALAMIDLAIPDAVILDLTMPEMDGFEVLKAIRESEKSARLPVLILTAKHVTKAELSVLKGNRIHQLIQKGGVSRAELLAAVAKMVTPQALAAAPSTAPAAGPAVETGASIKPSEILGSRSGKFRILVAEDHPDNMRTMRALLQEDYALIEAADGREAVDWARRERPDVILMDLVLPVLDGFAALTEIRSEPALNAIPVVAVTASAMKGDREKALAHGFNAWLSKPVDEERLRKTLREVLHGDQ